MNNDPQDKRTAQALTDAAKDAAHRATETAKELAQNAATAVKDAAHQATDAARDCCMTVSTKVDEGAVRARACLQQNPLAIVLGAVAVGIAVGCALALTRRAPTLRERFAEDPMQTTRDTLYAALAPVAQRLHDGYDSAGLALHGLHRASDTWSNQLGRVGNNLKFW